VILVCKKRGPYVSRASWYSPHVTGQVRPDLAPAAAWIETHYDALRGQWIAVRLKDPVLVAQAPILRQLWQVASPKQLKERRSIYSSL
jgi:hypothetical protein